MKVDTMTVDECISWINEDCGWRVSSTNDAGNPTAWINELYRGDPNTGDTITMVAPYLPTIDHAARAMPKEFWYKVCVNPKGRVDAYAERSFMSIDVAATDELTARYRLAVKCRMALKTRNEWPVDCNPYLSDDTGA